MVCMGRVSTGGGGRARKNSTRGRRGRGPVRPSRDPSAQPSRTCSVRAASHSICGVGTVARSGGGGGGDGVDRRVRVGFPFRKHVFPISAPTRPHLAAGLSLTHTPSLSSVVDAVERAALLARLDDSLDVAAGGSAANTLSALARLGDADAAARGGGRLRVALAPVAGTDAQAAFHAAELGRAGVDVLPGCETAAQHASTGTVFVLTTPDANRTFLSAAAFAPGRLSPSRPALAAASRARLLLVEGYLWAAPGAEVAIAAAVATARAGGALVAFTAGDAGVVRRHRAALWRALGAGWADVLFANAAEAAALLDEDKEGSAPPITALEAARALGPHVGLACVTDGASGAVLSALGELHVIPPVWVPSRPVDTNGAGDAFAAGALWGLLRGLPIQALGRAGARAASATIQHRGAALGAAEAEAVVAAMEGEAARGGLVGGPGLAGGSPLVPAAVVEAGALEC